jgi:hypothetical protein
MGKIIYGSAVVHFAVIGLGGRRDRSGGLIELPHKSGFGRQYRHTEAAAALAAACCS